MDYTLNYAAQTVQIGGQTYKFAEVGLSSNVTETEARQYLNGADLSKFSEKATGGADTFTSTTTTAATEVTTATAATTETKDAEFDEKLKELETKKEINNQKIDKLEKHIEELIQKAKKAVSEAKKEKESAIKKHEEETKKVVEEQLRAYIEANKNGAGMSQEELSRNIQNALPSVPGLSETVAKLLEANGIVNEIDSCVSDLKSLIFDTQTIENEINKTQAAKEAAKAPVTEQKSCDPIGFNFEGETYDFIVDDGKFDSTSDFLGADKQWEAMKALDTNGDNTVDAEELKAGNIKAVKGSDNSVVDLTELFGDDFSINLGSYTAGGSYDGIDTKADDDNDGVVNQQLLGTFSLSVKGQTVKGYNTLDDTNWLSNKFGITERKQTQDNTENNGLTLNETLQQHSNKADNFLIQSAQIRSEIQAEYKGLGLSKEDMQELDEVISVEAVQKAKNFFESLSSTEDTDKEEYKEEEKEKAA